MDKKKLKELGIVFAVWGQDQFLKDSYTLLTKIKHVLQKSYEIPLDWEGRSWRVDYENQNDLIWTNLLKKGGVDSVYIPQVMVIDPIKFQPNNILINVRDDEFISPVEVKGGLDCYKNHSSKAEFFDGIVTRVSGWDEKKGELELQRSRYFTYLKSNLSMDMKLSSGMSDRSLRETIHFDKKLDSFQGSSLANVLGINGLVFTSDGFMIYQKRNSSVLIRPNQTCSGFSGTVDWSDIRNSNGVDIGNLGDLDVLRELSEELGVNTFFGNDEVQEVVFLGMTRELIRGGCPELFYSVDLKLTKDQVVSRIPKDKEGKVLSVYWHVYAKSQLASSKCNLERDFVKLVSQLRNKFNSKLSIPFLTNLILWAKLNTKDQVCLRGQSFSKIGIIDLEDNPRFGQDFIVDSMLSQNSDLVKVVGVEDLKGLSILVSHNIDIDFEVIKLVDPSVHVVVHIHYQYNYFIEKDCNVVKKLAYLRERGNVSVVLPTTSLIHQYDDFFVDTNIVFNGVDAERYKPRLDKKNFFETQLNTPYNDELVVLFVGRLEDPNKGGERLKRIIENDYDNSVKFIVQHLPHKSEYWDDYIRSSMKENVVFVEDLDPTSDRPVNYSDVLISLSRVEVAPLVVLEALCSGNKVIATDSTGFYKELQDLGFDKSYLDIVDQETSEAEIVQEIISLIELEGIVNFSSKLRKAGFAKSFFSLDIAITGYLDVYNSMINRD